MEKTSKIVGINNLKIQLNSGVVIDYGSIDINLGDFILIRGRNGSGKSTLLKLFKPNFLDYCKVVSGSLNYIDDQFEKSNIFAFNSSEQAHLNRVIVDIEQDYRFENWQSAYSVIYTPSAIAIKYDKFLTSQQKKNKLELLKEKIKDYFEKYLQKDFKCSFMSFRFKRVTGWSGGQRKMISILSGIIKAEIVGSKLILMDEPLNNLDGTYKNRVNELIKNVRKNDVAILIVTHCHIFEGINKELTIRKVDQNTNVAELTDVKSKANVECLRQLEYYESSQEQ